MQNFVQPGTNLTVVAPYAVTAGAGVQVGAAIFGVALNTLASGATGVITTAGVFTSLVKNTGAGESYVPGSRLFWDNTNKRLTTVSTGNLAVGASLDTIGTGAALSGEVLVRPSTPAGT